MKSIHIITLLAVFMLAAIGLAIAQDKSPQPAGSGSEVRPGSETPKVETPEQPPKAEASQPTKPPNTPGTITIKIGVVNLQNVINGYKKTKEIEKTVEKEKQKEEDAIKKIEEELKELNDQLAALNPGSELYRETSEKIALTNARRKYRYDNLYQPTKRRLNEQFFTIYADIRKAIDRYAIENGYTLIFKMEPALASSSETEDISSQISYRTLLFAPKEFDITTEIIKVLNKD